MIDLISLLIATALISIFVGMQIGIHMGMRIKKNEIWKAFRYRRRYGINEVKKMVNVYRCPIGYRGKPSTEYVINGRKFKYCSGWVDGSTDEPLEECQSCLDHVSKAQEQYEQRMSEGRKEPHDLPKACEDCDGFIYDYCSECPVKK